MSRRIGIFGGTFDPPHVGHLAAAINVRDALELDDVLMVVAHAPWQKIGTRRITPSPIRLAMMQAALREVPRVTASSIEIDRGGDSYTADTLAELRQAEPDAEYFIVVGTDVVSRLETWNRYEELQADATLAIVERPGSIGEEPARGWSSVRVDAPYVDLSSSQLRSHMQAGRSLRFLVPDDALALWEEWWDANGDDGRDDPEVP